MSAGGDPKFHALGVALVVASNVARATKSCMQEMLLNKETALDSMNLLRWMSLFSMATLFPMALALEGGTEIIERLSYVYNDRTLGAALVANCTGAFMVNLSQFMVTAHVGALSMQVLGNLKNVFTSSVSVVVFQNAITAQGVVGYAITMLGAFAFGREKHRDRIAAAEAKAQSVGEQESEAGDATNKL